MTPMKVYLTPGPGLGRAIFRVANALRDYAPDWVQVVHAPEQAELRIWHVLGAGERTPILTGLADGTGIPYACVQYTLRTSEHPRASEWMAVWANAACVWSYYGLPKLLADEDCGCRMNFYYAPLGVDAAVFRETPLSSRPYLVGTSGYIATTEGVGEWGAVCDQRGAKQFHLGPHLSELARSHNYRTGISDVGLASWWSACQYVAAMRRIEGFEFPGVEGLLCGARPVCFDRDHYRQWYEDKALYVHESGFADVVATLIALVESGPHPVSDEEKRWAADRFNWSTLVPRFWQHVKEGL